METNDPYDIEQMSGLNEIMHVKTRVQCLVPSGHAAKAPPPLEHFLPSFLS